MSQVLNIKQIKDNKQRALIEAAKKSFPAYCLLMPNPTFEYKMSRFHEVLTRRLQDVYERVQKGEQVRLILAVPPRVGKSETVSRYFTSWILGKRPNTEFILAANSSELARKFGRDARDFIGTEAYRRIFPDTQLRSDEKSKDTWMTTSGGGFKAVGAGSTITGFGGKFIIVDDPYKGRQEAESSTVQKKIVDWYTSTLDSRLQNGQGAIIVIMQRWNPNDIVAHLLDKTEEKKGDPNFVPWELINFPAIAEEDEYVPHKFLPKEKPFKSGPHKGQVLFRKAGEALAPEVFPLESLLAKKSDVGAYFWASQYQQNPILTDMQEFHEGLFKSYKPESDEFKRDVEPYLEYYTLVDPAISKNVEADETVVLTIGRHKNNGDIYRVKQDAGKGVSPQQLVSNIFKHYALYKPRKVVVEQVAYQKSIEYLIKEEQKKRGVFFKVYDVKRQKKEERIRGLLGLYELGLIHHLPVDQEYETQLLHFPRGKHDDRIDCMSFIVEHIPKRKKRTATIIRPKITSYYG